MRARQSLVGILVAVIGCLAVAPDAGAIDRCQLVPCPDANRPIFFTSSRYGGDYDIFRMNADGTQPVRITTTIGRDSQPSVSRDRTRIAFTTERLGTRSVFVMNADGSNQRPIKYGDAAFDPSLNPDGTKIVFATPGVPDPALMMIDVDGSNLRPLVAYGKAIRGERPAWSPDGLRVAYVRRFHQNNPPRTYYDVDIVDVYNGTSRTVAYGLASASGVGWSPDGQKIAYTAHDREVYIADLTGSPSQPFRVTHDGYDNRDPTWAPDGSRIAFTRARGGRYELWTARPNGTDIRWFAAGGFFTGEADWGYPVEPPVNTE